MTLFELLNANAHLTPDQIASKLGADSRIVYFDQLTENQCLDVRNGTLCVLFKHRDGAWRVDERDWEAWMEGEADYFRHTLWYYACIPTEDYRDGLLPARPPERVSR